MADKWYMRPGIFLLYLWLNLNFQQVGKPKEMLLGLLELIDRFLDDSVYRDFLHPLQTGMLYITHVSVKLYL